MGGITVLRESPLDTVGANAILDWVGKRRNEELERAKADSSFGRVYILVPLSQMPSLPVPTG